MESASEGKFGWADYLVCGIMLLISASIGVYYKLTGDKQRTNREYLLADRNASMIPVAFSLMATFMSAITLLGVSSENYMYGTQFVVINLSYGIFTPVAAFLYIPVFYKLQATSAYEYLERRFGRTTRVAASVAFSLQMILYMGIVVYAPALALEAVTGLDRILSILAVGLVCTFYSTLGGMKAVLITDVFQSILMFTAVFSIIICGLVQTGFVGIWKIAEQHGRIEFWNFSVDPTTRHTWWTLNIGGGLTFLSLYAVNQAQVQRYLSVGDLKTAQKSLFLNWPILTLLSLSTSFAGLVIFSKYADCDPLASHRISSPDQLMPLYVVDTMGYLPGVSGLFVAGIFSGSLSTVSGALNSLSAVTVEDYIKPLYKHFHGQGMGDGSVSLLTKLLCLGYGVLCLGIAFAAQYLGAVLQAALTIFGVVGGPLLGVFTLGMFIPVANQVGALVSLAVSLSFGLWLGFGGPKPPLPILPTSTEGCPDNVTYTYSHNPYVRNSNATLPGDEDDYFYLYRISYQWYIVLGLILSLVVGTLVSWLAVKLHLVSPEQLDPDLFVPPIARRLLKIKLRRANIIPLDDDVDRPAATIKRTTSRDNNVDPTVGKRMMENNH